MSGQNFPELANRAGDEVLPQSDSEDSSGAMDIDAASLNTEKSTDHVSLAGSALSLVRSTWARLRANRMLLR